MAVQGMEWDGTEADQHGFWSPSAGAAQHTKLQLPAMTAPPGPRKPPKQLVWVVSGLQLRSPVSPRLASTYKDLT